MKCRDEFMHLICVCVSVCIVGLVSLTQCACSTKEMKSWPSTTFTLAAWRRSTCTSASPWRMRWIHPRPQKAHTYNMKNEMNYSALEGMRRGKNKTKPLMPPFRWKWPSCVSTGASLCICPPISAAADCKPSTAGGPVCLGVVQMALPFCERWVCSVCWPLSQPGNYFPGLWVVHSA